MDAQMNHSFASIGSQKAFTKRLESFVPVWGKLERWLWSLAMTQLSESLYGFRGKFGFYIWSQMVAILFCLPTGIAEQSARSIFKSSEEWYSFQ